MYPMRAGATLLSGAGLVALALAVGLYGVIAYSVAVYRRAKAPSHRRATEASHR